MNVAKLFEVELIGNTLVVNLRRGLDEIEFDNPPADANQLLERTRRLEAKNVVVDCHEISFLRSTALGFFVTLWKRVGEREGRMAFCNLSANARQILHATKLDQVWMICDSRSEALDAVSQ